MTRIEPRTTENRRYELCSSLSHKDELLRCGQLIFPNLWEISVESGLRRLVERDLKNHRHKNK